VTRAALVLSVDPADVFLSGMGADASCCRCAHSQLLKSQIGCL